MQIGVSARQQLCVIVKSSNATIAFEIVVNLGNVDLMFLLPTVAGEAEDY